MDVIEECRYWFGLGYWEWRRWLPSRSRSLRPNRLRSVWQSIMSTVRWCWECV